MQLPSDFEKEMTNYLGKEEYTKLAEAINGQSPTSIRINRDKISDEEIDYTKDAEKVSWCENGYYLNERPQFTFDPLLHAGCYYVQEASSMFLSHILKQHFQKDNGTPIVALDLCAAPGGKSTLTMSMLPKGSLLFANEVMRQRANILAENLIKWGYPNCIVTNSFAKDFQPLGPIFDLIICDAPCSGEGMFRKDPASIDEWSLDNVETCWKRQREIAQDIWPTLKDDALFIYSTCTYNPHEDEETVEWIADNLGAEILSCNPNKEWGLTDKNTHFFPSKSRGEGFFISVLRKKTRECQDAESDDYNNSYTLANSSKKNKKKDKGSKNGNNRNSTKKTPQEINAWIKDSNQFTIYQEDETFHAFPTTYTDLLEQARQTVRVVHAGIDIATIKGKNLQPCHSLALSNSLNREAFVTHEIDYNQAIAYLRTESIQLDADVKVGYVLITFKGHPLGFVKNIGSRANNLYPSEWKIKSTYTPHK